MAFLEMKELPLRVVYRLKIRGLKPVGTDFEIHGPHGWDFPEPVYIVEVLGVPGCAKDESVFVVVNPSTVFQIEDTRQWNRCKPECRIRVRRTQHYREYQRAWSREKTRRIRASRISND